MDEVDEFGIPIKKANSTQPTVDEFGIPVKKKVDTTSTSTIPTENSDSVQKNGSSDFPLPKYGADLIVEANKQTPPTISELEERKKQLQQRATLPNDQARKIKLNPKYFSAKEELADIDKQIQKENSKVVSELENKINTVDIEQAKKNLSDTENDTQAIDYLREGAKKTWNTFVDVIGVGGSKETKDTWKIDAFSPLKEEKEQIKLQNPNLSEEELTQKARELFIEKDLQKQRAKNADDILQNTDPKIQQLAKTKQIEELGIKQPLLKANTVKINILDKAHDDYLEDLKNDDAKILQYQKQGKQLEPEFIESYNQKIEKVNDLKNQYSEILKENQSLYKDVQGAQKNLDLFKLNYSPMDKYVMGLSGATVKLAGGALSFVGEYIPATTEFLQIKKAISKTGAELIEGVEQTNKDFRRITLDDVQGARDLGRYVMNLTVEQAPIIASMAIGGEIGLAGVGASSGGEKINEMRKELELNPSKYSDVQVKLTGLGYALAEAIPEMQTLSIINGAKRTISEIGKDAVQRELFRQGIKDYSTAIIKANGKMIGNATKEGLSENLTGIMQDYIDEKNGVKVKDKDKKRKEEFFAGFIMGGGMTAIAEVPSVYGYIASQVSNEKQQAEVKTQLNKLATLEKEMSKEGLTENDKKVLVSEIKSTNKTIENLVTSSVKNAEKMSRNQIEELVRTNTIQADLRSQAEEIKSGNLSDDIKKAKLADLKQQFVASEDKRIGIQEGRITAVDLLPITIQDRIKRHALKELTQELNPDGTKNITITNEQIVERANKLYKTEQENLIKEENAKTKTETTEPMEAKLEDPNQENQQETKGLKIGKYKYNGKQYVYDGSSLTNEKGELIPMDFEKDSLLNQIQEKGKLIEVKPQDETQEPTIKEKQKIKSVFPETKVETIVHHGTMSKNIDKFNTDVIFFTDDQEYAKKLNVGVEKFGTTIPAILDIKNPLYTDKEISYKNDNNKNEDLIDPREVKKEGIYDGIIGKDQGQKKGLTYVVFNNDQIHRLDNEAQAQGNIIPDGNIQPTTEPIAEVAIEEKPTAEVVETESVESAVESKPSESDAKVKENLDLLGDKKAQWMNEIGKSDLDAHRKGYSNNDILSIEDALIPKKYGKKTISRFERAILEKRMTAEDAVKVIKSAGIKVPKEITDLIEKSDPINHAIEQIDKGVLQWSGNIGSPRIDLGLSWADIRKGEADLKRGKVDSVPAKRLVEALDKAKEEGGYRYKYGTGGESQRTAEFVTFEDMERVTNEMRLTNAELEEINKNEDILAKEHEDYFNSLDEKTQLEILENYENTIDNQGEVRETAEIGESKNDVSDKKTPSRQEKIDIYNAKIDDLANALKDLLPNRPHTKGSNTQGISQDDLIDFIANSAKQLVSATITIEDAIRQVIEHLKNKGFEFDEKVITDRLLSKERVAPKDKLANFRDLIRDIPQKEEVKNYLSGETIERVYGEKPTNDQSYNVVSLADLSEHGKLVMNKAKELFGDQYVEKTLDFLENSNLEADEKAIQYVALENEMDKRVSENPNDLGERKLQELVNAKSQAHLRKSAIAINAGRLRAIMKYGIDVNSYPNEILTSKQKQAKNEIEKLVQHTSEDINKEAEIQEEYGFTIAEPKAKRDKTVVKSEISDVIKKLRADLIKSARGQSLNVSIPYAEQVKVATPHIIKLSKLFAELGGMKTKEIIDAIHDELSKVFPVIKKSDISSVLKETYQEKATPKDKKISEIVKQALIDSGFSRTVKINGEEKKLLDWKKLAGEESSIPKLKENVEKSLKEQGYTDAQISEIGKSLEDEYIRLGADIVEKGLRELENRNKIRPTPSRKSEAKRLSELYNYGLFNGEKATEYDNLLNKTLGLSEFDVETYQKIKELAKALASVYNQENNGKKISELAIFKQHN